VNTEKNWGNTIILNHLNGLFSQISHVKKDSFNVFIGQYVTKGTYLARCGNSGRSPEPHIHFQLQTVPTVGAKTLPYPIAYFVERMGTQRFLRISKVPTENSHISNVHVNELLSVAFYFYPGQKISLSKENGSSKTEWEVRTDSFNRTHFYCSKTDSYAYFVYDGVMLYFTDFEGDHGSLLFQFYLAAYRQLLGYYDNIEVKDRVPLIHFNHPVLQFFQDFFAPFYLFTKANYSSVFTYADNVYAPQKVMVRNTVEASIFNYRFKQINFEFELKDHKIHKFSVHQNNRSDIYIFNPQNA
jgi:hypothetical protein